MSGSTSSYDHLVKQVEALRKENSHLRRELEDNSSHLTKLETETSDMKEMLKQLQNKLEQEASNLVSTGRSDILDQLTELNTDIASLCDNKWQSNMVCTGPGRFTLDQAFERNQAHPTTPLAQDYVPRPHGRLEHLEELNEERALLLSEIEKEEKEKAFYCAQIQNLGKRADEMLQIRSVSKHMDLIRQQLQYEAHQIKAIIEERYGTGDSTTERLQMRMNRVQEIEKEILQSQQRVRETETEGRGQSNDQDAEDRMNNLPQGLNNLGSKVEMVFWLLSMLATRDKEDMSRTLLAMSSSQDSCVAMRKSGCLPLLIQLLHDSEREAAGSAVDGGTKEARARASAALHNIVYSQPDEGQAKREMRVLHVLEQVRLYCDSCWEWLDNRGENGADTNSLPLPIEPQICQAMCAIMKLSFDEEYRRAMNELGGLQAVAELLQVDCDMYGATSDPLNSALRRYAGMALTNLTFGDVVNKATLCSRKGCMQSIVAQLESDSEDIHQVVASILRNLSWRADVNSKRILREVASVTALMQCALKAKKESTLKSLLSALWNLSAHSTENKVAICSVDGALIFLVGTLTYKCQSNSLAIIESGGGILRNVSSLIATNEEYRQVLRDYNCLQTLLQHLKSHSLTIVSNACGTLWNLSARNAKDQELLWDMGAVSMLRNLIHSKHKMIAMGSAAALRNLLTNRPAKYKDTAMISPGSCMPSLYMRKQKALEAELDAKHLSETFDSIEKLSPKHSNINKPLRHIESLAKDYASDSGCFDDDEGPNISTGLETGGLSMLSMYLNSSFLQGQGFSRCRSAGRSSKSERDLDGTQADLQKFNPSTDNVSIAAERLVNQISTTVARIDKIVEDMSHMHTSSEDSFSLSSEDQCIDWQSALDDLNEPRTKSSSPRHLADAVNSGIRVKAQGILGARTDNANLSSDSLECGNSTEQDTKSQMSSSKESSSSGHKEEVPLYQKRPNNLVLKNGENHQMDRKESDGQPRSREPRTSWNDAWGVRKVDEISKSQFSPFYERSQVASITSRSSPSPSPGNSLTPQSLTSRKQAWVHSGLSQSNRDLSQGLSSTSACTPSSNGQETLQTYCVEDTPICFSRCSSLSSLSSAENALDVQIGSENENDIDSDSSLEIIGVEKESPLTAEKTISDESLGSEEMLLKSSDHSFSSTSQPIEIPCPKQEKFLMRKRAASRNMDSSPSSLSDNYLQETPLVLSRCSSVSSLGSFESPSIVSSIQSDPCSEMVSGTISPSDLPDSPGQTMPPSRSKTPLLDHLDKDANQVNNQWDSEMKKHMDINEFKERFQLPADIDTMLYFTLEKPNENFSCASSLSALTLHEPYIQKDIELKLMPLLQEKSCFNCLAQEKREDMREERTADGMEKADKLDCILENSDDDIEILKECINSAMPTKFRKVISGLSGQVLQSKKSLQLPVYMLLPDHSQLESGGHTVAKNDNFREDSSYSDSVEGTPVNFSSSASLSDETLEYPQRDSPSVAKVRPEITERRELIPAEGRNTDDLEVPISIRMHEKSLEHGNKYHFNINEVCPHSSSIPRGQSHLLINVNQREVQKLNQNPLPSQQCQNHNDPVFQSGLTANILRKEHAPPRQLVKPDKMGCKRAEEGEQRMEVSGGEYIHGSYAFQSMRHTTPTEEAVYCFYENDTLDRLSVSKDSVKQKNGVKSDYEENLIITQNGETMNEPNENYKTTMKFKTAKMERSLITDESPLCSLSSSLSSLSDVELEEFQTKTRKAFVKSRKKSASSSAASKSFTQGYSSSPTTRDSSPSSPSYDSEDDLLQKCISSAMPKKRKHSSKQKSEKSAKQSCQNGNSQTHAGANVSWDLPQRNDGSRDVCSSLSDLSSPDVESFEWKAIQEGANSIVTSLHQAAACLSREPSSESDSILSFVSGLSVGSTLHFTLERKDKKRTQKEQPRDLEAAEHIVKEGKKLTEHKATAGKPSNANRGSNIPKQPSRAVSLPVIFRGRTVIYMPDMWKKPNNNANNTPSKKAIPKNNAPSKNLNQTFRSRSLHRPGQMTEKVDTSLPKRSVTPPARITRGPSRGSSRNSTPSRQPQRNLTSSTQPNKQVTPHVTKTIVNKIDQKQRTQVTSLPSTPNIRSPASGKLTRKSPVQVSNSQAPAKPETPVKKLSTFQKKNTTASNKSLGSKKMMPPNRLDLVRMSSAKSSGSESDKSNFVRQLTFIKESPGLLKRQKSEASSSESISSLSQSVSPRRSKSDFQAALLRSSQCPALKVARPALTVNASQRKAACKEPAVRNEKWSRRPSSESPSRLPVKNSAAWKQEHFKRYSSSPHINVLQRAASPSSTRSASSESSDKTKSEEELRGTDRPTRRSEQQVRKNQPSLKGTWRRIKDEDIPYFLSNSLPPSAMTLVNKPESARLPGKAGVAVETKTSDAFVQTEDFPITKTNSSTSPTLDLIPHLQQALHRNVRSRPFIGKSLETIYGIHSTEQEPDAVLLMRSNITSSSETESHSIAPAHMHFNPSRHGSPSRAARVTPFNYIPSPKAIRSDNGSLQPSQIRAPIINEKTVAKVQS
ncbi:adenomatous polyposis coli protein 2 isoform X1 [Leucoraja erinacea]|uniref:adenomatous polyposis coli protein 2 isoform X1 n=1 Tax=Leucoraja erinaceus TaxID=7782 RepID=UPI0024540BB1|nr:adenomatous polyposis coli protein 2 isoform X1 [Leucoraja erinacea]